MTAQNGSDAAILRILEYSSRCCLCSRYEVLDDHDILHEDILCVCMHVRQEGIVQNPGPVIWCPNSMTYSLRSRAR